MMLGHVHTLVQPCGMLWVALEAHATLVPIWRTWRGDVVPILLLRNKGCEHWRADDVAGDASGFLQIQLHMCITCMQRHEADRFLCPGHPQVQLFACRCEAY